MAENEYLDSTKSRQWLSVADGLNQNCTDADLFQAAQTCFYRALRDISKSLPLAEFVESISDIEKLRRVCASFHRAETLKHLFLDAAQNNAKPEDALRHFLSAVLDNYLYDIPYLAADRSHDVNLSEGRQRLANVRVQLNPDIRRIAEKLAANPSWKPSRPRREGSMVKPVGDATKNMLGHSLLAGFRKAGK